MALAETTTRTTLLDVARTAGVSVATVDRVLNGRAGVRARSVERVHAAVKQLNYRPDPAAARLARQRLRRIAFVLPSGTNSFIALLREQVAESRVWLQDHRAAVELVEVDVFEPQQVAGAIAALQGRCDAAIVMAMDHPLVRNAIGE
ncbi:MAG TPA: LacI family DNA-binding transcriptional regulator, partial [Ramlibacter sp.]|nr:LacI family DNA-binding transcriptional regulator [Ramlibacter sp.]